MRSHRKSFEFVFPLLAILAILCIAMPVMAGDSSGTAQNPQWYKSGWGHRKAITIDRTKVVSDQKDFPVMINLGSDPDLAARAQSTGNDLVFTLADGTTKLPCKVESYTNSNGALVAWVKVPALSSSANTVLYMYYGNHGASNQQDTSGTWTDVYKGNWRKRDILSWVQTEFNNHNNPSTFYSRGADEAQPQTVTPAPTPTPALTPDPTPAPATDSAPTQTQQWNDCGWNYRRAITIDRTKVMADQTDFPVLINIASDPSLAAHAQSSGNDILFTLSDERAKVPHKIESYTSTTGALAIWVKVPALSSSANTILYMYYGNPGASNQQDTAGTWSYRYKGTWSRKAIESWIKTKYNNQMNPSTFYILGSEVYQPQSCTPTPLPTPATPAPELTPAPASVSAPADPAPTPIVVDPTPIPTPSFTCPADSYPLVTQDGETSGCIAITNDWTIDATTVTTTDTVTDTTTDTATDTTTDTATNTLLNTLSVSYTMADSFCLRSADVAVAFDSVNVPPQFSQPFDASVCTKSFTFDIPLGDTGDVSYLYVTPHGVVQKVTEGVSSADMDVSVPENSINYIIQG